MESEDSSHVENKSAAAATLTADEITAPPARRRRLQSRAFAERLAGVETLILNVNGNAELSDLLAAHGFDSARLTEGAALHQAAQQAFLTRQQAIGAQRQVTAEFASVMFAARRTLSDFRIMARTLFPAPADHARLDLDALIPADTQAFLSIARTTYRAALDTPTIANVLALYGYPAERLNNALDELDVVVEQLHQVDVARSEALQATQARQIAAVALDTWLHRLLTAARLVTRKRPDLRQQINI